MNYSLLFISTDDGKKLFILIFLRGGAFACLDNIIQNDLLFSHAHKSEKKLCVCVCVCVCVCEREREGGEEAILSEAESKSAERWQGEGKK